MRWGWGGGGDAMQCDDGFRKGGSKRQSQGTTRLDMPKRDPLARRGYSTTAHSGQPPRGPSWIPTVVLDFVSFRIDVEKGTDRQQRGPRGVTYILAGWLAHTLKKIDGEREICHLARRSPYFFFTAPFTPPTHKTLISALYHRPRFRARETIKMRGT